jgi:acetylglutamate kinase
MDGKSVFVIKYGGAAMLSDELRNAFVGDIAYLRGRGARIVIVHGGGNEITTLAGRLGIETVFVEGLRYTGADMMDVVQMVLAGKTNKDIVAALNRFDLNAMGLSGVDLGLIRAERATHNGSDIGFVGTIESVHADPIRTFLDSGILPVIAPLGVDAEGQIYNINADHAAASIAEHLHAAALIYLSNIEGVMVNGTVARQITAAESEDLIQAQIIDRGMIPKVRSAFSALRNNVGAVHIIDGRKEHAVRNAFADNQSSGTKLVL